MLLSEIIMNVHSRSFVNVREWSWIRERSWMIMNDYEWTEGSWRFMNNLHEQERRELLNDQNCNLSGVPNTGSPIYNIN